MSPSLHPFLDGGFHKGDPTFSGGKLHCHCKDNPVEVTLAGDVTQNHACGCSKCWKPKGALFSIVAVVPTNQLTVSSGASKIHVVDQTATILRHACRDCGVHVYSRIDKEHPFKGLDFVHVELSDRKGWQEPQFAAFVSSIIEQGFHPDGMEEVRNRFRSLGLETYDTLSPPLMDAIATWTAKKAGLL